MGHHRDEEKCDLPTLRHIIVGLLAHSLKRSTVPKVVKDLELVIKEMKITKTADVELFLTHVLHDAADLRMKDPDAGAENQEAGLLDFVRALQDASGRQKR